MKIIQLVNSRRLRGAEIFAGQLTTELTNLGAEVHYVALYQEDGPLVAPENGKVIDLKGKRSRLINIVLIFRLCRLVLNFQPDVVQANAGDTLKYAVITRLFTRSRFKLVFRNASLISRYLRSQVGTCTTKFLLQQADAIISVSDASRRDTIGLIPELSGRTTVVPIGITFIPCKRSEALSGPGPHLVHVGGFSFEKNHAGLLRIFTHVKKEIPTAKLWLASDGPLRHQTELQARQLGIEASVTFLGSVSDPIDVIHAADALLLPSIIEGVPAVLLEAFWCGTPVVASSVGGIPEVVIHGETGWLVDPQDELAFADRVLSVLRDREGQATIIEAARRRVIAHHANEVIAKRFLAVYHQLTDQPEQK